MMVDRWEKQKVDSLVCSLAHWDGLKVLPKVEMMVAHWAVD